MEDNTLQWIQDFLLNKTEQVLWDETTRTRSYIFISPVYMC